MSAAKRAICACGWSSWEAIFDTARREAEIAELERQTASPDLWSDPTAAQELLQRLSRLKERVAPYRELASRLEEVEVMLELLAEAGGVEENSGEVEEIEKDVADLTKALDTLDLDRRFSGEHDAADAIMEIKAGAGGTDAQDWVSLLQRMYLRWAEAHNLPVDILDEREGEVAGLKSTTIIVHGRNAYGLMKAERGVHRLVRISPFDANKRRQTSFASVEVLPDVGEEVTGEIDPDDLRIDYYRSSGAGGQHVNKTDSAVRLTHLPTGLVVTCQNERSQHKNKALAMKVLHARLLERERRESEERMAALRGETKANEWGNQDRSYVFQPYTMVKDHRTGHETGDVVGVMNGNIDPFLVAYLQWQQARENVAT